MTSAVSSFSAALIFRSIASSSPISSTASRRRVLPTRSRGLIVATSARACGADRNCFAPPGNQFQQQPMQPVDGLGAGPAELVAAVDQHAHHDQVVLDRPPAAAPARPGRTARPARPSARRPGRSCGRCRWRRPAPAPTASAARPPRAHRRARAGARCVGRCRCSPRPPTPAHRSRRAGGPRRASRRSRPCPCRTAPPRALARLWSMTSIVAERLCGSIPMITPIAVHPPRSPRDVKAGRASLLRAEQTPLEPLLARCPTRAHAMREPHQ